MATLRVNKEMTLKTPSTQVICVSSASSVSNNNRCPVPNRRLYTHKNYEGALDLIGPFLLVKYEKQK